MKFNQIILEKLGVLFQKCNLNIIEQRDNYLKLLSKYLVIIIAHNQLENSNTIWLGRNDDKMDKVEVDNKVLKLFFGSDLKLSDVSVEIFVKNLVLFFENEAQPLLRGDIDRINKLEEFDLERSQKYTQGLLDKQSLVAANKAWDEGDYREFIKLIDETNKDELPSSYQLKYKIAVQKL
ncbi:hypothetical protein [Pedobacter cryoconitis]|uniref:Uncharacterized protein n=1 Tax=Pedobacter cryoconitis TaxID=188932 RepID=A0A7X0IZA7_9SPHI|nr:hypothetical protein [Pedobacter cryoconitis]MBB6498133.1 hypothetical protein [Pedobacter cryoconitis]